MRNIIKRIIIGVAIGLILFFLKSHITNAKNMDSISLTTTQYLLQTGNKTLNINLPYNTFNNYGSGKVIFNFYAPIFENSSYNTAIQTRLRLNSGFVTDCKLTATYQINYNNYPSSSGGSGATFGGIVYQAECDTVLNNTYLNYIDIEFRNTPAASQTITLGSVITFVSDTDTNGIIDAIRQYSSLNNTSQILTQLQNFQLQTGNQIQSIYDLINNSNTTQQQLLQQQQQTNQKLDETNDFLKDSSSPNTSDMDFSGSNASNGVISDLVTMPIRLVQSFLNGFNSSCQPFNLGNLLGTDLVLPCINIGSKLGAVWTIIDTIISGLFIYVFGKSCVKKFNDITNMKENQIDEVFD